MNRRILIALGIAAIVAVGAAATDANAGCAPVTKDFKLAFGANNQYLNFPPGSNASITGGVLKGRFWQSGNRALANEGTNCPEATYMIEITAGSVLSIFGQSGGDILGTGPCDNLGCVAGAQIQLIQTLSNDGSNAYYAVGKVLETAGEFDFSRGAVDWTMAPMPRPRVSSSSRGGTNVTVNLTFDAPSVAARGEADSLPAESIVTGYQLLRFTGTADPGRNPAAWGAPLQTLATSAGGATVTGLVNDCSNTANDVFLATRVVFDGGQFQSDYVSEATRIECDPTLADPRFKLIDKKKPSRGSIQPR